MKAWPCVAAALFFAEPLFAQAYGCRVPARVAVPRIAPDTPPWALPVTGYTLALSWSPAFCRTRQFARSHARQCSGRAGQFGLVVHGLRPESGRGWPQWCRTAAYPAPADLARNMCITPSPRLLARQWAKHGSCMARRPETYYKITRILWNSLVLPDLDRLSRQPDLTAGDLRAIMAAANPSWSEQSIGLVLDSGWLQEVRLCYDRRFRPASCDKRRFGPADDVPLKIWRGL